MPCTEAEQEEEFSLLDERRFSDAPNMSPVHVVRWGEIGKVWEDWNASIEKQRKGLIYLILAKSNTPIYTKQIFKHFFSEVKERMDTDEPFPKEQQTSIEGLVDASNLAEFAQERFHSCWTYRVSIRCIWVQGSTRTRVGSG